MMEMTELCKEWMGESYWHDNKMEIWKENNHLCYYLTIKSFNICEFAQEIYKPI